MPGKVHRKVEFEEADRKLTQRSRFEPVQNSFIRTTHGQDASDHGHQKPLPLGSSNWAMLGGLDVLLFFFFCAAAFCSSIQRVDKCADALWLRRKDSREQRLITQLHSLLAQVRAPSADKALGLSKLRRCRGPKSACQSSCQAPRCALACEPW